MTLTGSVNMETDEVPQLVRRRGLVAELIGCLDDHESGAGDQVVGLEKVLST